MKPFVLVVAAAATTLSGCAGATIGSGVGDKFLDHPPYAAGAAAANTGRMGHLPITYQRGSSFDPVERAQGPLAALLDSLNRRLDATGGGRSVPLRGPTLPGRPPNVSFGCEVDASGDCLDADESTDPHAKRLRLAVGRPSQDWVAAARQRTAEAGATTTLVITVEIGQYWVHQRNLLGAKEVRLGTDHVESIPWLTSLEAPVQVVQLTGALVGPDGRALRIAAEGMLARRTSIVMSGLGAQALITDAEIVELLDKRRNDLPSRPLVWEAALESLLRNLSR